MRRWLTIAAFGAALLCTPLWAQRGGHGGMSGGFGGRAARGVVGHPAGGTVASRGFVAGAPARWAGGVAYPQGGGYVNRFPYHYPSGAGFSHHFPYRYPLRFGFRYPWFYRWGYPFGYGYVGWYGYPGWVGYGDTAGYGDTYSYPVQAYPTYDSSYEQSRLLQQEEIDRLNDEVARLRSQTREPQYPAQQFQPPADVHGETVLIFRDSHTEQVQNYAIVRKTLWIFNEQRARKVPIAELDVAATTKANEDRGVDFRLPR